MRTIHIYTVAYNRPDFIALQYASVLKHILQPELEIQFWLLINTKDFLMREKLAEECKRLKVQYRVVPIREGELYNGGLTAYNYIRNHFFPKTRKVDYSVIMDSDMFLYNSIDIEKLLGGNDVAAIYHQRQKKILGFTKYNYEYLWVGFMVFSHQNFDWKEIKFEPIKNICDVGGMTYYYLRDNIKKGLKIMWLNHTPDITHEFKKILPENLWKYYNPTMGFQIIENLIIHYYKGSNWDGNELELLKKKNQFLNKFTERANESHFKIDSETFYDSMAYSRKHFNGILGNKNEKIKIYLKN